MASSANLARYDPSGKFIAAGRPDGMALIWDLETRAISRYLEGHVKAIMDIECVTWPSLFDVLHSLIPADGNAQLVA